MSLTYPQFWFSNSDFRLLSLQFVIVFVISFIFGYLGVFFVLFLPLMLFFAPYGWYFLFGWVPMKIIKLGQSKIGDFLNFIPFVKFKGIWLMDRVSTTRNLNEWQDFKIFMKKFFTQFAIINTGVMYFFYEIETIAGEQLSGYRLDSNLLLYFVLINLLGMLFVIVTVLEDVNIRVLDSTNNNRVTKLVDLAYSFKGLFLTYFGFSLLTSVKAERGTAAFEQVLNNILIAALYGVGVTLFMSFLYYKSKFHERLINDIRREILEKPKEFNIKIGEVVFDQIQCNNCFNINEFPNYFCRKCGLNISEMKSQIFDQPVRVGSLIHTNERAELDIEQLIAINHEQERLWTTRRKIKFVIFSIIPFVLFVFMLLVLFTMIVR